MLFLHSTFSREFPHENFLSLRLLALQKFSKVSPTIILHSKRSGELTFENSYTFPPTRLETILKKSTNCINSLLKLQVSFHKRATNYRALLRKMTHKDEASYTSLLQCGEDL